MKKLSIVFLCLLFSVTALHARAIQEDYKMAEEKARVSYAIGMIIANNFDLGSLGLEYDYNAMADGIKAVTEGIWPEFSIFEAIEIVETALYDAMEIIAEQNWNAENEFLISNSMLDSILFTPSGLQYEIIEEGNGDKPHAESVVRVHYIGTFTDGRVFDSSYEEEGAYIPLDMVIPGWAEGVMLMSVGSIYRIIIPSHLAYGREGIQGIIPPYTPLIFMVELLEVMDDDFDPYQGYYDWDWEAFFDDWDWDDYDWDDWDWEQ